MSGVQYADEVKRVTVADLQKSFTQDSFGCAAKKNVLVLVGHPNTTGKSLSHALANTALQNFTSHGDDVRVVDLYKIKFGFGGKGDFRESLWRQDTFDYQWEQRTAVENGMENFSDEVREQLENLLWADIIIYVFPLFWFHAPAVMKSWQDRIFAWHLTYGGDKSLEGKEFMTVVTCGASQDIWKNVLNSSVEDVLKGFSVAPAVLMKAKVLPTYIVYNAHGVPEEKPQRHAKFCADFEMYLNAHRDDQAGSPRMLASSHPLENLSHVPAQYADDIHNMDACSAKLCAQRKKNVLILLAHNNFKGTSLNHRMAKRAQELCEEAGHKVRLVDLDAIDFGIGGIDDFKTLMYDNADFDYQWEQRTAAEKNQNNFSTELQEQLENLKWADLIMFQFPMYWFHMPAIMKAWLDRVLVWHMFYGAGFNLDSKSFFISTTLGMSEQIVSEVFNTTVEDLLKGLTHLSPKMTKAHALPMYISYESNGPADEKDKRHPVKVAEFEEHFSKHIL